ncbi:Uncharacterized protein Adt_02371 [Abeliophyllum distichum]|uniref:Uncharacterized protein n=1 Tax=Abeliophyllum distichum TaxID=126358 RepID=A0ABD1VVJ4_9LAMI
MSSSATGGDALGRVGGEAIPIDAAPSLREADDLFRVDVVMWAALDVPSIMVEEDLTKLREAYMIHADIELILSGPNERACFPRRGCTTLHLNAFWKESWFWVSGNWQRVFEDPEPDLDVSSVYGIANSLLCCELSRDIVDVLRSIYQADPKTRSYRLIMNRHRCLVELGLMASKGKRPRPTLARLTKQRPKVLVQGSAEDTS